MKKPVISVLIPVYNQSRHVKALCQNILTYISDDVEVLIQDDFSTDDSYVALVAQLRGVKNVRINRNEKNLGARENTTALLRKVSTPFVLFSAGDDFILPGGLKSIVNRIRSERHADFEVRLCWRTAEPYSSWKDIRFDKVSLETRKSLLNATVVFNGSSVEEFFYRSATYPGFLWLQGVSIKESLVRRTGYLPEGAVDDWGLLHNIAQLSLSERISVETFDEIISVVGISPGSLGSNPLLQLERQLFVVDRYWNEQFKKSAFLNLVEKKIRQFRQGEESYEEIVDYFLRGLEAKKSE